MSRIPLRLTDKTDRGTKQTRRNEPYFETKRTTRNEKDHLEKNIFFLLHNNYLLASILRCFQVFSINLIKINKICSPINDFKEKNGHIRPTDAWNVIFWPTRCAFTTIYQLYSSINNHIEKAKKYVSSTCVYDPTYGHLQRLDVDSISINADLSRRMCWYKVKKVEHIWFLSLALKNKIKK